MQGVDIATEIALRLDKVLDYLERQLCQEIDLSVLAQAAHFSPSHFIFHFKQHFGLPPVEYLRNRRVLLAASRLRHERTQAVGDIAAACGFGSYRVFAKVFRQAFSMTANEWRHDAGWRDYMLRTASANMACGNTTPPLPPAVPGELQDVRIHKLNSCAVYSRHVLGAWDQRAMQQAMAGFFRHAHQAGLVTSQSRFIGKFDEDPGFTPRQLFTYEVCLSHPAVTAGLHLKPLPGGYYACASSYGYLPFKDLYENWLECQTTWELDSMRPHLRWFGDADKASVLALPIKLAPGKQFLARPL